MTPLLDVKALSVTFGGLLAVDGVDLTVERGTVVGLIGPKGAGKTTFVDAVTGFVRPSAGVVTLDGRVLERPAPARRARLGMARTFDSVELFDDLTVRENLTAAADRPRWWSLASDVLHPGRRSRAVEDQVDWAIGALALEDVADESPRALAPGERTRVGVARAVAARPKLLVLDEPMAGLDTAESRLLPTHLRDFVKRGMTVLLVEQDLGLVLDVCQEIYVLDVGAVIAHGPPADIVTNPAVAEAYRGESRRGGAPVWGSPAPPPAVPRPLLPAPTAPVPDYGGPEGGQIEP